MEAKLWKLFNLPVTQDFDCQEDWGEFFFRANKYSHSKLFKEARKGF